MCNIQKAFYLVLIISLINFSCLLSRSHDSDITEWNESGNFSTTDLNISTAYLVYNIKEHGGYSCHFTLEAVGNSLTESGNAHCEFSFSGIPISDISLFISIDEFSQRITDYNQKDDTNTSKISFNTTNHIIPRSVPFTISGSYYSSFIMNESGIFTFDLGIDWGKMVSIQYTSVEFEDDFEIYESSPMYHMEKFMSGKLEYTWVDFETQGFNCQLKLKPIKSVIDYLHISISSWNASIGETLQVSLLNNARFEIHFFIIFPNWITSNLSSYNLNPNQKIIVEFSINNQAIVGLNSTIDIGVNLNSPRRIPVRVISIQKIESSFPLLQSLSLISLVVLLGIVYYKKDNIIDLSSKYKGKVLDSLDKSGNLLPNTFSKTTGSNWQTILPKWENILPENELNALEILYKQGKLNQKAIATELGISETTMSRILSRLETKRLIIREPLGMSKMIKLNKDRL